MADFEALAEEAHFANVEAKEVPRRTAQKVEPAFTAEDKEIDLILERAAKSNPIQDLGPEIVLKPEHKTRDILRNHMEDYKPASTLMELEEQVSMAKQNEIDSIEATPALVRHLFKSSFDHIKKEVGYGLYKDIRVYIEGFFNDHKDADKITMEQKLHGGSKLDTVPIITPQKV